MEARGQIVTTWEAVVTRADGTVEDLGEIAREVENSDGSPVEQEGVERGSNSE